MRDAYICGVGLTEFGKLGPASALDLQARAASAALADSGFERRQIDGLLVGYVADGRKVAVAGERCDRLLRRFGVDVLGYDNRPLRGEPLRDGPAESGACAGDACDPAGQQPRCCCHVRPDLTWSDRHEGCMIHRIGSHRPTSQGV